MPTIYDDFKNAEEYKKVRTQDIARRIKATKEELRLEKLPEGTVIVGYDDLGGLVCGLPYLQVLMLGKYTLGGIGIEDRKIIQCFEDSY